MVGDSLAAGLGVFTERVLRPGRDARDEAGAHLDGARAAGLLRLAGRDARHHGRCIDPDLVMVMTGVNDNQSLRDLRRASWQTPIGTYEWPPAYEQRVEAVRADRRGWRRARACGWGCRSWRTRERWPLFQRQNDIFQRVAARTPNMVYVDAWDRFAQPDGGYSAYYRDDGKVELIRESDGIHFNGTGYEMVARAAVQAAVDCSIYPRRSSRATEPWVRR